MLNLILLICLNIVGVIFSWNSMVTWIAVKNNFWVIASVVLLIVNSALLAFNFMALCRL